MIDVRKHLEESIKVYKYLYVNQVNEELAKIYLEAYNESVAALAQYSLDVANGLYTDTPVSVKENPTVIFEEGLTLYDWLDWFYEELPIVPDKCLTFKTIEGTSYLMHHLPMGTVVQVRKATESIFIVVNGEEVFIELCDDKGMKLFDVCSYERQQHQIDWITTYGEDYE